MAIQAPPQFGFALDNSQDLVVDNACGFDNFCFLPQQQHQLIEFDQFQNSWQQPNLLGDSNIQSMTFSQNMERERLELEHFFNLQKERLRTAVQEKMKQQTAVLMKKYESKSEWLVKQKEEEIAKAENMRNALETSMKRMEMEKQTWQRIAKQKEAMIATLNCSIQWLRESASMSENAVEDAESCQNICFEEEERKSKRMVCRWCNWRNSCVVMLPCQHLCCCKDCEVFLDSCPLCRMPKKDTIQALM